MGSVARAAGRPLAHGVAPCCALRTAPIAYAGGGSGSQPVSESYAMPATESAVATARVSRVWWYLALLTMRSFAIGLGASLLLCLAVVAVS